MTDRLSEARDSGMTERAIRTQGDILEVATAEFAANGYAGARVDEIAARTRTTKRMIYYYFGSKEGLYLAVLERVYAQIRQVERGIRDRGAVTRRGAANARGGDVRPPHDAPGVHPARQHREHPSRRAPAAVARRSCARTSTAITLLEEVIERGVRDGIFRDDVDALDVHMIISAYACFHVANRHTFAAIFDRDMLDPRCRIHTAG